MQERGSGDAGKVKDDEGEKTTVSDAAGARPVRHLMASSPHPTRDYLHTLLIRVQGL